MCVAGERRFEWSSVLLAAAMLGLCAFASPVSADSIAVQPDGRIVVGGAAPGGFEMLARLRPNGSLDPTFGDGGLVVDRRRPALAELVLQGDGKTVASGWVDVLRRFEADGSLDLDFAGDGSVSVPVGGPSFLSILPDGRIAMGGNYDVKLVTLQALAYVVSSDGWTVERVGEIGPWATMSAFTSGGDRSLLMAGSFATSISSYDPRQILARFVPGSGAPYDPSFGGGSGFAAIPPNPSGSEALWKVLVAAPGAIYAAGSAADGRMIVARFSPDGAIDAGFGSNGFVELSPGAGYSSAEDVAVMPDGKILLAGSLLTEGEAGGRLSPLLLRLLPDGSLDAGFGQAGVAPISGPPSLALDSVLAQPGGSALVAGSARRGKYVARVQPDGQLDPAFGEGGTAVVRACPGSDAASRKGGCLPSIRARLAIHRTGLRHARLQLDLRPDVTWSRIRWVRLNLPPQLRPLRGRRIVAKLDMRPGRPPKRTTEMELRRRRLSGDWPNLPAAVSIRVPPGALRVLKSAPRRGRIGFRLAVGFESRFNGPLGVQRTVLRHAIG